MNDAFLMGPTGRRVYLEDPFAGVDTTVLIEEIAAGLSNELRFSGHLNVPYTVAQHSISVSTWFHPGAYCARWHGLMHDASEAYLRDIPKPLKALLPDYRALEKRFTDAINKVFNVRIDPDEEAAIHEQDWNALCVESELIGFGAERYGIQQPLSSDVLRHYARHVSNPLDRDSARLEFVRFAQGLYDEIRWFGDANVTIKETRCEIA